MQRLCHVSVRVPVCVCMFARLRACAYVFVRAFLCMRGSDQASTPAPADEELNMFGREEALRLDEEIMNFPWAASRTSGARRVYSHRHDSGSHPNKPSMPSSVPSQIMDPPYWHPNQHGKSLYSAAGSSWAGPLSTPQKATATTSWKLDLTCFCVVALVSRSSRKSAAEQKQSRVRKVATVARSGERECALAAARNAPPVPVTQQIVQEIKVLCTTAFAAQPSVSHIFLSQFAELIPITLKRVPRLSEPGPLSMRAEHWYDFGENLHVNVNVRVPVYVSL